METRIVYCDETGDDGLNTKSSDAFILTSIYMPAGVWQSNFNAIKAMRQELKDSYGFHVGQEMHTKHFLTDKNPYREYKWTKEEKTEILKKFTVSIASLEMSVVNVIIDKAAVNADDYDILEHALTYSIQRIENDSHADWNFLIITDKGRVAPMKKTARAIRVYNPIQSQFGGYVNRPIKNLIEDILEKDSSESYFVQTCDFISYFVHLYFLTRYKNKALPNRVGNLIDNKFVGSVMATFSAKGILNEKASREKYGLVIYPRK